MTRDEMLAAVARNVRWFCQSGVMEPADGSWGVAERVLLTASNETAEKTLSSFPAWRAFSGHCIVEQRRADCNFEAAYLMLVAGRVLGRPEYRACAHGLLEYLYCRSGLLLRNEAIPGFAPGVWNWSHIKWVPTVYFDDNAWACLLQLLMADAAPDFDAEFGLRKWGLALARELAAAFPDYFAEKRYVSGLKHPWLGRPRLPHWGSLVVAALACAHRFDPCPAYRQVADLYHRYLLEQADSFTTGEYGYALLGAGLTQQTFGDALSGQVIDRFIALAAGKTDPATGNLPSEHFEAPSGAHLCDTIYTMNWLAAGLQGVMALRPDSRPLLERAVALLGSIQDRSPEPHLSGCWRGMYDLTAGAWGGGNRYEGGADSIYTGWTNAPIAWTFCHLAEGTVFGETGR